MAGAVGRASTDSVAAMSFLRTKDLKSTYGECVERLLDRGIEVSLACYGHGQWEWDGKFELLRTPSIPGYRRLRAGPDWVKPGLDVLLAGLMARQDGDIFHAHECQTPLAAFLGRRTRSIPLFYSAHTLLEEEFASLFWGATSKTVLPVGRKVA